MKKTAPLLYLLLCAVPLAAQLQEQRVCPAAACFVSDRGKVVVIEPPIEKYSDKKWLQIRYEQPGRPKLPMALAAVRNVRTIQSTQSTYDGEQESTTTYEEPVIPIGSLEDLLADAIRRTRLFDVVERLALDAIQAEREITYDALGSLTAGKYVAVASVNEFAETSQANVKGIKSKLGKLRIGRNTKKVAASLRIVDVASGRVVFSTLETAAIGGWGGGVEDEEDYDQAAEVSVTSLLSRAVMSSLNKAAFKLARWAVTTPWTSTIIKVDAAEGDQALIYISGGRQQGVQVGMRLVVWAKGEELLHPVTGDILGYDRTRMGTAVIRDVQQQFSIARMEAGNPNVGPGDQVELLVEEQ